MQNKTNVIDISRICLFMEFAVNEDKIKDEDNVEKDGEKKTNIETKKDDDM